MKTALATAILALIGGAAIASAEPISTALHDELHPEHVPGVDLAQGISTLTGTAISPLLGVSGVGAWQYFRTPPELRDQLPWFAHPSIWGCGFALLAIVFLKDSLGAVSPPLLKTPLNMAELLFNIGNGMLASAAFVPIFGGQIARYYASPAESTASAGRSALFATVLPSDLLDAGLLLLLVPLLIASFVIVWMAANIINVLIALSPFGFIDAILKLVKTGLLAGLALAYLISPYLGIAVSILMLLVAASIAGFAFRFTVFGALLAYDVLFPWRARRTLTPNNAQAFIARRIQGLRPRTYGRLSRAADGTLQFIYRPWLILSTRTVALPAGTLALSKGLLYPSLLCCLQPGTEFRSVVIFLPRYHGYECAIADCCAITDIRENVVARGFNAVRAWLAETLHLGKPSQPQFAPVRRI
jgi:hypothetical protein